MYDVIVVGGGHAGIEAALATARLNKKTILVTGSLNRVGFMSCNPSIGGPAKGVVVREIDALGGQMAKIADLTQIQMKMLNRSKGPAVWALRAQIDKQEYPKAMLKVLESEENLELKEALVDKMIVEDNQVKGIVLQDQTKIFAKVVIITTGTYLASRILKGHDIVKSGPDKQPTTYGLSNNFKELGFKLIRLKTGTPARIRKSSINYAVTTPQYADDVFQTFSFTPIITEMGHQEPCYLTHTTERTHEIINAHLDESAMYGGVVEGVGPRYCPSIEDKVVRFRDKNRHQVFLEPETMSNDEIYLQGLSTSMPENVQEEIIRSVPGLENAEIVRYAYAIEYDAIDSTQLYQTLETRLVKNLYCAGQINGTSGYEEAACQGLMAGINASLKIDNKDPLILKRNEAYIGVLIDDLVSKGTEDPYRLLTSRAEHRLLLRHDNADLRLREYGYQVGLVKDAIYQAFKLKEKQIGELIELIKETYIFPNAETNDWMTKQGFNEISQKMSLFELLKRPEMHYNDIKPLFDNYYSDEVLEQAEIIIKYEGYIKKAEKQATKMVKIDDKIIPDFINYDHISNLALEARDKLKKHQPKTLGQASRISGVNPSDISVLLVYLQTIK